MSLVGAFLRCKGTGGSGPVCILRHSLTLPYALYTSIDFGALAKYTTHCARMTWKEGENIKWFVLSSNVCYPDVLRSVTRPRPSFVCWPPTADGYMSIISQQYSPSWLWLLGKKSYFTTGYMTVYHQKSQSKTKLLGIPQQARSEILRTASISRATMFSYSKPCGERTNTFALSLQSVSFW